MEKITKSSDKVLIDPNEPLILPDGTALVGRVEWFLYALCCLDYQNLPTPMSRIEEFANALITGEIPNIQPQSRAEQFFLAILDGNISDLPQPQSRSEVLLDKLARGEFDLSDVEPIQSSYELLLAYLIKNGGIGNIDYVLYEFSEAMKTMYNTVEKPFKSLELSGNTLVNCVLEDTENDDYTSFDEDYSGTSFTINGTSEGAIKSAILKGQTLVNLQPKGSSWVGNTGVMWYNESIPNSLFKPNTKYFLKFNSDLSNILESCYLGACSPVYNHKIYPSVSGCYAIMTTNEAPDGGLLHVYPKSGIELNSTTLNENVRFVFTEYQEGMENWDIPYFEGMQSVKMPVLTTTGKNLFNPSELIISENQHVTCVTESNKLSFRRKTGSHFNSSSYIQLEPNTKYWMTITTKSYNENEGEYVKFHLGKRPHNDSNEYGDFVIKASTDGTQYRSFTTDSDAKLYINGYVGSVGYDVWDIMLEKVEDSNASATPYEPYKSNILTTPSDLELHGIGDVKDELNLSTGEMTERIGEIVLDGSQDMDADGRGIFIQVDDMKKVEDYRTIITCDKLPVFYQQWDLPSVENGISGYRDGENKYPSQNWLYIKVNNSIDVDEVRQMLIQNPITVQYALVEESIKTVDLNVVDQNNTKIDKIHVFNEVTHVNASSDELTPTVNIGKSVSYPTIIKPNTKYTVDLKRNDKPLTVNLGGTEVTFASDETRKTITTPSTLTNDKLSYYGVGAKCNEIMLIEGEIERNIDYFTGMQSVVMQNQMPILSTVGKNLFDINKCISGKSIDDNGELINSRPHHYAIEEFIKIDNTITISIVSEDGAVPDTTNGTRLRFYDKNKKLISSNWFAGGVQIQENRKKRTFTVNGAEYLRLNISATGGGADTSYEAMKTIQIENGSSMTSYEPHKSSILSCNDEIELNGIETYKDVLDCNNKKITRRTLKLLLNGSDDVQWNTYALKDEFPNVIGFYYAFPKEVERYGNKYLYNGSLPPTERDVFPGNIASNEEVIVVNNNGYIKLSIYRNKLKSLNADGLKEWLSENPIELTYVLKNPIVSEVELSVIDQDGNTIPKIKSYNNVTHLEVTIPKQSLLPHISAEVATDNSKDMSSLTTKHQEISEAQSTIEDNIQSQSDEIDTALMATTEIFESILE